MIFAFGGVFMAALQETYRLAKVLYVLSRFLCFHVNENISRNSSVFMKIFFKTIIKWLFWNNCFSVLKAST